MTDPDDPANIYIYNSGTSGVRSPLELAGCENADAHAEPRSPPATRRSGASTSSRCRWPRRRPRPSSASRASSPTRPRAPTTACRTRCPGTAAPVAARAYSPAAEHQHLPRPHRRSRRVSWSPARARATASSSTPRDPVNPVRLDAVSDPNFSYWHSASFNNDGTKVIFTDEWGGGTSARCRVTDKPEWGADALFDLDGDQMEFASYYKMPAVQTTQENCVAHNSSLVPVPGRDILVQAWYQGGLSVIDFSDTANPVEIAYFDRGPINTPEPDRAQPRRPLVDLLVQRPGLRQRDRPRLRHLRADDQRPAERERARRGPRGAARRVQRPAPGADRLDAELQRRRRLLRPGRPLRRADRQDA